MSICKNCGKNFPVHVEIDGKMRNLQRRNYCLECSPFGMHNTSKIEKPKQIKRILSDEQKHKKVVAVQKRRLALKIQAVEYKGGKCCICGYNRYVGALDFHHKDSSDKSFGISEKGWTISWERIKDELDKCILVCSNCHREIEAGIIDISDV